MDTSLFEKGQLFINGKFHEIEQLSWNEHPDFKGVFLKHLIKGESTMNQLSCHLVKINPGCEIGWHKHPGKTEIHEIIKGSGCCKIEETKIEYKKGIVGVIPADTNHSIEAQPEGLFLLAKFFPALL